MRQTSDCCPATRGTSNGIGPDGRTVYVTEVEHQRLVQFRVDRPGLAWRGVGSAGEWQ
ncbi:MAG TPA: hypothetical protein VKM56_01120 [Verrucomicrobiae bacterium]|nr:hypothetical protein [Verrucomicrobiae bacterium]